MKMKSYSVILAVFIFAVFFFSSCKTQSPGNEMSITTSSKEALNFFLTGRDKLENIESVAAASFFDKAIQKDPDFAMAYLYRSQSGGGFNVFRQNLDKAVSLANKVSEGEKLQILSFQASADGNSQKQKEHVDQLLKLFPSDKRVHIIAGNYYYYNYNYSEALVQFTKSTELDNKFALAYNMIGYCQSALNNYQEAEKAFQTYIKLIPDKANPYDSYAELLLKMGKYDESVAQYKKALEKDPSFSGSLAGIGDNYVFKGDYESARKYYQEYFDKASAIGGKLTAIFLKATSFVHEGKIGEAVTTFDEYRALAEKENLVTNSIMSYAYQGFTLAETGKPNEGIKYFEKANDLIEKSKLPETTKENFITSSMLWRFYYLTANDELENAMAESEKCKSKVESRKNIGEEMFLNSLFALLEIKKGNYDKAIQYFSKADTEDPFSWYYDAVAYNKKGDKQNASKLFEKISKRNVNSLNLALVRKRAMEEFRK